MTTILILVPAIVWLLISAIFFACGEYLSKTWAANPSPFLIILIIIANILSALFWLPALLHKNQLAIMGTAWLLFAIIATIALGIFVFHEKINIIQVVGIFLALLAMVLLSIYKEEPKVCINDNCFFIEVAKTAEERARGLMFRESLSENRGMLFIFEEEGTRSFWMKNTKISLDIIWIDAGDKIVHIEKNVLPCEKDACQSYKPIEKAKYVLEINAGLCDKFNISVGNVVYYPNY